MYENQDGISRRSVLQRGAIVTGVLALGGTAMTGTTAADIGEGRVLDYHLNNVNYDRERGTVVSGHVHDASPYNNHGEWVNYNDDPVVTDAPVGNGYAFDGDDYVAVGASQSLEVDEVSIAAWINPNGSAYDYIVDGPGHNYYLKLHDGTTRPEFGFFNENGFNQLVASSGLPTGAWSHVAATYSVTDGTMRLYVEGSEVASNGASGPIWSYADSDYQYDSGEARVGRYLGTGPGNGYFFDGMLDEVRVYDRALSGGDVVELATMDEA